MGEARQRQKSIIAAPRPCIFCGGGRIATTEEHCPPRALFKQRQWPQGYAFPACQSCNSGSSNEDLMVSFLAHLQPGADQEKMAKGRGLMRNAHRQFPELLQSMLDVSVVEARASARRLGMRPGPGQAYRDIGIVNVTPEMNQYVAEFAAKLTKALYYKLTGQIFPSNGGIMFKWFTNAERMEHGSIPVLDAFAQLPTWSTPKQRSGKDLRDQFDYLYSPVEDGKIHVFQVGFGVVFGFVTIASPEPGRLEEMETRLNERSKGGTSPFTFVSTNRGSPGSG